ncbi:DEAD/DEAH box helicase [Ferrovum sp.]|jgi:ATP-dependent helicase YprA (DUF1998 family)|uniref:DEAD/DEAH box helicase n=1 Tax=Ferrovum sp. TaxID=2609467 RepID=UPI00262D7811|nr:DEAD/DEAH box helicase [Ferrovum sp.]
MTTKYFSKLLPHLSRSSKQAAIGQLGFANTTLRRYLNEAFDNGLGVPGNFVGDPAFEAMFGWKSSDQTMEQLAGTLLTEDLVLAMDSPPPELAGDYRFASDQKPYTHQLEAWRLLSESEPKSVVVASGTGSGKTECFMVPILDRLVRLRQENSGKLVGVRALFLYPLNALINSQRDRLRAWTNEFGDDIRFCLYNGNTQQELPQADRDAHPNEVLDRKRLWASPPPMLVTNATMLEYMLVRTQDAPILNASQGKLEWVVLDEAHTYIGSQAAEVALLIRRVLHAFGVTSNQVRFIATSATIGDPNGEAGQKLKAFLAQVSGVDPSRVHLVAGQRQVPALPSKQKLELESSLDELANIEAGLETAPARYEALSSSKAAVGIRDLFVGNKPVAALGEVGKLVPGTGESLEDQQSRALQWLDLLSGTRDTNGTPFLPLRGHLFHQTLTGIWACSDPDCSDQHEILRNKLEWPFGQVWLEPRQHCSCGSPVYEVVTCDSCRTVHLQAAERHGKLLHPATLAAVDEFELEVEAEAEPDGEENLADEETANDPPVVRQNRVLVVNRGLPLVDAVGVNRDTRAISDRPDETHTLKLLVNEEGEDGLTCPACGETEVSYRGLFQSSRIGAPFLLGNILPLLLEYAPDGTKPSEHPYRGRRLLTFNDSRQGTARIAARLQQESERNRIRGLVYHQSILQGQQQAGHDAEKVRQQISGLEAAKALTSEAAAQQALNQLLKPLYEQLEALLQPKPVGFEELARSLTNQGKDFELMLRQYRRYSAETFGSTSGPMQLAQMFLVREFGRRPKRQNSLETMGLVAVQYPALSNVGTAPPEWTASGLGISDWRDFLKITLDFYVRAQGSITFPDEWRNWLGMPFAKSWIVDRDAETVAPRQRRWPRAKRSRYGTLVRLLAYVFRVDVENELSQDRIDAALLAAWNELIRIGLLVRAADGFMLDYRGIAFAPITKAWVCPVTRRFLDTTLRGVTPYLPRNASPATADCQPFNLPIYPKPFGGQITDELAQIEEARAWISTQDVIAAAREDGLWTGLNDRVIELSPYFVTAEHSAQQDSAQLDKYEKDFKRGDLNLLSCSTTMEMGIDIGGISVVAMNNVPPHPANYLQRAGRAGRRKESRSLSLTLCKANPHDQSVFSNSRWAFDTPLPAPIVSLNSPVIVQRHVNALALASFLAEFVSGQDFTKLTCDWFFTGTPSPSDKFLSFCRGYESQARPLLSKGLQQLVRHSAYEGIPQSTIIEYSADAMDSVASEWNSEWSALLQQEQETLGGGRESPAHKALLYQKGRTGGEYLLRELATRGFLPGYGFPSHITSFDNLTIGRYRQALNQIAGREDNRYRKRELPSRDRVTALREYAPGSEVVMDGLMYRSAGITLNWHIPATQQDASEIQEIKFSWRCHHCGASGSTHSLSGCQTCEECSGDIKPSNVQKFLEPAGFAVDFFKDPTNDVTTQHFVPVEQPWITARGEWQPLANAALGRFRTTSSGHIFYHSDGIHRQGYAICLACGRAAPMLGSGDLPQEFAKPHKKLRGGKLGESDCPGSSQAWAIQRGISLGHEAHTDVLEIQLKNEVGLWIKDSVTVRTIGIALRDALAELLGVQASELACDIKEAIPEEGKVCQSILIYDRSAAGYASSASRHIEQMFRLARNRLQCKANCDSSCPHCILDFDQRFAFDGIDRFSGLGVLSDAWLNMLRLPDELALFGEASQPEYCGLNEAILRERGQRDVRSARLFFSGRNADLGPSPLRRLAYRLAGDGTRVDLVVDADSLNHMDEADKYLLASLADHPGITISSVQVLPGAKEGVVLAEVSNASGTTRWGVAEDEALEAGAAWGSAKSPLVVGKCLPPLTLDALLQHESAELRTKGVSQGDMELEVSQELNGPIQGFGKRLWDMLTEHHKSASMLLQSENEVIADVTYSDRYLWTPVAAALLVNMVEALRDTVGQDRWDSSKVAVRTTYEHDQKYSGYPTMVWNDWKDGQTRDAVLRGAFDYIGIDAVVQSDSKASLPHGRSLEVSFKSRKTLTIRFDQGVSYWKVPMLHGNQRRQAGFGFEGDAKTQGASIAVMRLPIAGSELPTEIFAKVRE